MNENKAKIQPGSITQEQVDKLNLAKIKDLKTDDIVIDTTPTWKHYAIAVGLYAVLFAAVFSFLGFI